ncbi:hypothetical protein G6F63_014486 [Rhizopus arrhizus]|nr:hypothetical protein G6F63_014486 [Rhizopus arrhizus]
MVRGWIGDADLVDARTHCHRQQQARTHRIELAAELGHQCGEVGVVFRLAAFDATGHRVFPVDVDAVEHAQRGSGTTGTVGHRQVALDVGIDARGDEGLAVFRAGRAGEAARPGPATQRDQHLHARILGLELLELVPVAAQRLVPGIGAAADTLGGTECLGVIGEGIATGTAVRIRRLGDAHFAAVVAHVAERIVELRP